MPGLLPNVSYVHKLNYKHFCLTSQRATPSVPFDLLKTRFLVPETASQAEVSIPDERTNLELAFRMKRQSGKEEEARGKWSGSPWGALRKFPTYRDKRIGATIEDWLRGKEMDDGAEGLWRVHDELYDLSDFAKNHPGGEWWLKTTKGTDITEAFESHHISEKAEKLLGKFHVRKAKTPRNSLITFHDDGLFRTLKRKVRNSNVYSVGSSWQTRALADFLLFGFLTFNLFGMWFSPSWSVVAGIFLHMLTVCAHNFFHMKDNIRMYYFNFSLLSYRDWRISHALSHHQYVNTLLDLEITMFEPFFNYLPKEDKHFLTRFLPWLMSPVVFFAIFYFQFLQRNLKLLRGCVNRVNWDDYLGLSVPLIMWSLSNGTIYNAIYAWNLSIISGSFLFGLVGLTAAHHHPDIYHEGDYLGENKDFGILQLAAVRDRREVNANFFLTMILFGEHALHHIFPTIDHAKLPALHPHFIETCKQFNIEFEIKSSASLILGMYQQLARNYVNGKLLITKAKSI